MKLCANMTLLENKGPMHLLQTDLKKAGFRRLALSLVGKVLTNKMVNRDGFIRLISEI